MKRSHSLVSGVLLAALCAAAPHASAGEPENIITLTTTADVMDGLDHLCSLREALSNANTNALFSPAVGECAAGSASMTDVIVLAMSATYNLSIAGSGDNQGDLDMLAQPMNDIVGLRIRPAGGNGTAPVIHQQVAGERVIELHGPIVDLVGFVVSGGNVDGAGGGILNDQGSLALKGMVVTGNSANAGGGIYNGGDLSIIDSDFTNNLATLIGGGALFTDANHSISLDHSSLMANIAPSGGGIYNVDGGVHIGNNSKISSNASTGDGGGVYNAGSGILIINDSEFSNDQSPGQGGAIFSSSSTSLAIFQSVFMLNTAASGGAICVGSTAVPHVTGGAFNLNTATNDGGAISAKSVEIAQASFASNMATQGGAIFTVNFANVSNSAFVSNSAASGGAIHTQLLTLDSVRMMSNNATLKGGGAYVTNYAKIDRSRIENGTANADGAGLWLHSSGDSTITRTLFTNNNATNQGGGLWVTGPGTTTMGDVTISDNTAGAGGGLYLEALGNMIATNVTLANNPNGKDLYKYGDLTLQNSIISTPGQDNCVAALDNPAIVSFGHNLSDDTSCIGLDQPGDHTGINVLLDVLADNGGNTLTHALLSGSPAIDAGLAAGCDSPAVGGVDQRGIGRGFGGNCDIGAYEMSDTIFKNGFD
ncbi:MAG: choice-of-anchor Q domain-containing protein [Dokdonella sp.]